MYETMHILCTSYVLCASTCTCRFVCACVLYTCTYKLREFRSDFPIREGEYIPISAILTCTKFYDPEIIREYSKNLYVYTCSIYIYTLYMHSVCVAGRMTYRT